jgi:hypothetical protein
MLRRIVWGTAVISILSICASAQEFRGTITGRVTDAQSASVPNAKILVTLLATGGKSQTATGTEGLYTIPFLAPGTYRMEVEAPGFKRYIREGVEVTAGERVGLDIEMSLGQLTETISVTADAPLLDTTSATAGQVINSAQVENMPQRSHAAVPGTARYGRGSQ